MEVDHLALDPNVRDLLRLFAVLQVQTLSEAVSRAAKLMQLAQNIQLRYAEYADQLTPSAGLTSLSVEADTALRDPPRARRGERRSGGDRRAAG